MCTLREEIDEGVAQLIGVLWWCSQGPGSLPM
jgi:hypothetical protein